MIKEYVLKLLGNIGQINLSRDKIFPKVEALKSSDTEYVLFFSVLETHRILACKFTLNKEFFSNDKEASENEISKVQSPFLVSFWKTLHLPFCICDLALSNDGLWIIGEECYSNIKPYIVDALKIDALNKCTSIEDDFMDIDADDFNPQDFEFYVQLPTVLKHNIANEKFYLKCDSIQESIIIGSKNMDKNVWQFDLVTSKYEPILQTELSDSTQLPGVHLTYKRAYRSYEAELKPFVKPIIILYPVKSTAKELEKAAESKTNVLHLLLSDKGLTVANSVGIIGHPDGKVFYFLCSWTDKIKDFAKNIQVKEMYDIKQPIVGIHIVKDLGGIKGTGLLIVGSLGKVTYISAKLVTPEQKSIAIVLTEAVTLYAATFELPSYVQQHVIFRGNIFFLSSDGKVQLSEFSKTRERGIDGKENLIISKSSVLMQRVANFLLLNEITGLFLFITNTGCLYLSEFTEKKKDVETFVSLPSLMNEAMHLSSELQKLSTIKSFQTMFFKAVSTFATIKFTGLSNLNVKCTYSLTEVKNPSRKLLLVVDIKGLEGLEMKSDCWFITASIYSCFQKKCAIITKTVPLNPEKSSIYVEIEESIPSSPHSSLLPLMVELGLILTLPEEMKSLSCFKHIKEELPLYVKVKELHLNELCLMQIQPNRHKKSRSLNQHQNDENLLANIFALGKRKTIFKLLKSDYKTPKSQPPSEFPVDVRFCMLQSCADKILKLDFTDAVLPFRCFQIILQKTLSEKNPAMLNIRCLDKTASINISTIGTFSYFTVDSEAFDLLTMIRMAITSTLIALQSVTGDVRTCSLSVSAKLSKDCEVLSKELSGLYGLDVNSEDFIQKVLIKYKALRKISSQLIFC